MKEKRMTLQRICASILVTLILCNVQIAVGQDIDGDQTDISVRVTVDSSDSFGNGLINEIVEATRSNLEAYGVSIVKVIRDPYYAPFGNFGISLSQSRNFDGYIFSASVNPTMFSLPNVAPFLVGNYGAGAIVPVTSENHDEDVTKAVQYSTIVSLYSIGLCDEAISHASPLIAQLEAEFDNMNSNNEILVTLLFLHANCAIAREEFDEAVHILEKSRHISENLGVSLLWLRVRYYLAWVYIQTGRENDAETLIDNSIETARGIRGSGDDYNDALINSARLYELMSDYDAAIRNLSIYMDHFCCPAHRVFYVWRGTMYRNIYEWDRSLEDFNTAIDLAPDYAEAYFQRGLLYYSVLQTGQELRDEALADFQRYLELAPEGQFADQAQEYITTLEAEMEALNSS